MSATHSSIGRVAAMVFLGLCGCFLSATYTSSCPATTSPTGCVEINFDCARQIVSPPPPNPPEDCAFVHCWAGVEWTSPGNKYVTWTNWGTITCTVEGGYRDENGVCIRDPSTVYTTWNLTGITGFLAIDCPN